MRRLLCLVIIVAARSASAQNAAAEVLFNQGDSLMAAGNIAEACEAFEASNRVEARAGTLIRLGECREQNHQLASAWSAYRDALARAKDPRKHDIAQAKAADLEPKLSYLTISVSDEARVAGLEITRNGKPFDPMLWNRALPVDGGEYVVGGRAPAHEEWTRKVSVPETGGHISVDVPKFKEVEKLLPNPAEQAGATTAEPGDVEPRKRFTGKRKIAIGVAAGGAAALVTGIVLGVSAKSKEHDALALCPDPAMPCADAARASELDHSGHRLALGADVAFGVAGAAAIAAGVLWFVGAPESRTQRVSVIPTGAGALVEVRF